MAKYSKLSKELKEKRKKFVRLLDRALKADIIRRPESVKEGQWKAMRRIWLEGAKYSDVANDFAGVTEETIRRSNNQAAARMWATLNPRQKERYKEFGPKEKEK